MNRFLLLIITIIKAIFSINYESRWLSFPACKMGRLQSPIRLNETESIFSPTFSIVYQNYKDITTKLNVNYNLDKYAIIIDGINGGFIHFQKGGVIKQYELIKIELYKGLHPIGPSNKVTKYELHFVFKKNLGFVSNKNQYRRIQDPNNYLVIALRYSDEGITDNGLLKALTEANGSNTFNLGNFPIFQEKKAYYYDGSFIYSPCKEDVSYYVVEPIFKVDSTLEINLGNTPPFKNFSLAYERPIYRNFMNFTESLFSNKVKPSMFFLLSLIFIGF